MRKLSLFLFIMLLALPVAMFNNVQKLFVTLAATNISFDNTDVINDLSSSTLDGALFDINNFPYDTNGTLRVINFVEFGYSYYSALSYNYGLYIYVYNPRAVDINTNSLSNKIQMASLYSAGGTPTDYTKYDLKLCSQYEKLFYKFKINFTDAQRQATLDRIKNNRRYDISSVELFTTGGTNAIDYNVGFSISVSGYAAGYGEDARAESNLSVFIEGLETLSLDVGHTFFRNLKGYNSSIGLYSQLDTVYFAVPNSILEYYGKLQKIKAAWYEYKLKKILVTKSSIVYNRVQPYLGEYVNDFNENIDRMLAAGFLQNIIAPLQHADWVYNAYHPAGVSTAYGEICNYLYLMFKTDDIKSYDPSLELDTPGSISSSELYQSILNYDKTYANGTLPIKDGTISADLFENTIDSNRIINNEFGHIKKGYSYYDFDYDLDLQNMYGYQHGDNTFWEDLYQIGLIDMILHPNKNSENDTLDYLNVLPIYAIEESDWLGSNEEISKKLFINKSHIPQIHNFYKQSIQNDKTMFLFRFANTEYQNAPVSIIDYSNFGVYEKWDDQCYIAQETVFFDFDIIQLTFLKDDIYRVIPVVSNPIDIVNDIVPPYSMPDKDDWWKDLIKKILFWVAVVVIFLLIFPFLPTIIVTVFNIILLPFRLIIRLFKGGG